MSDPMDTKTAQAESQDSMGRKARPRVGVRLAGNTKEDIDTIVRLISEAVGESRYRDLPFSVDRLREFVYGGVQANKLFGFILAERSLPDGSKSGIGVVCATAGMLPFADVVSCGVLLFYVTPSSRSPRVAALLTESFKRWSQNRRAYEATFHVTMGSSNDNRVSKLLELYGFLPSGSSHFKGL